MTTANLTQWLDLEADARGPEERLAAAERDSLDAALAADPRLRAEKERTDLLHAWLRPEPIEVSDGFTARVMDNLPQAAWQSSRSKAAWRLPLAAMLALALGAAFLFGGQADGILVGTGLALADFLQATVLAGAGLLEASWRGIGLGLEQLFEGSPSAIFAFAVLVIGIDLLFVHLLRRRRGAEARSENRNANDDA